jgi:thiol:disulfide interchange protein DsbD
MNLKNIKALLGLCWFITTGISLSQNVLPPEQAFPYDIRQVDEVIIIDFSLPDGYYLYKDKFNFSILPNDLIQSITLPDGETHEDEFFGVSEVYRSSFEIKIGLIPHNENTITLTTGLQGCADIGLCYPPQNWTNVIEWSRNPNQLLPISPNRNPFLLNPDQPLGYDDAFFINARFDGPNLIIFSWDIEPGYYMYQPSFSFLSDGTIQFGTPQKPTGEYYSDSYFGNVEIYRGYLEIKVPFSRASPGSFATRINASSQGCKDGSICYPPSLQSLDLIVPPVSDFEVSSDFLEPEIPQQSEQSFLADFISNGFWLNVIASFFGFGLLLSFSPCVLPMIPILSGLILNPKNSIHKPFVLALSYVMGMSVTYTLAGVLAALAGQQAQSLFQQPWIIGLFSLFFLALGLSMIELFNIALPSGLQNTISKQMGRLQNGSIFAIALMGALSGLIVTACVAPPLIGALLAISESGNVTRGAVSLFSMSLGMGFPLLLIGMSAQRLVPKVGAWMNNIKSIIGLLLIATSVYLVGRVLTIQAYQILCGFFLIFLSISIIKNIFYFPKKFNWLKITIISFGLVYGSLVIFSSLMGGIGLLPTDLRISRNTDQQLVTFIPVSGIDELTKQIELSINEQKPIMLEITADWCVSCRELERYTFSNEAVATILMDRFTLLRADVTNYNDDAKTLLESVNSYGPPTILFYNPDGGNLEQLTLIGFVGPDDFIKHIEVLL